MHLTERARPTARLADGGVRPTLAAKTLPRSAPGGIRSFADLGAAWLVTPHLGIGAKWRAAISYTHATASDAFTSAKTDRVHISLGSIELAGQLYS